MKTDMNKKQKNTRTFLIKIMDQQNGTWQPVCIQRIQEDNCRYTV